MPQPDRLGLKENPFQNSTDQRYFYADQSRAQIMESTEHLIEYSNNLQVIIGAPGMGKSHMLETLVNRVDNNWRIAKIKDTSQYDTLSLIQEILNSLAVMPDDDMELLETLETQLAEIIQLGFKPVLFIDNAQCLSVDSIRFLLQLSQQKQNDEPYINIVLFATTEITERLQVPELRDFRDVIHITTLDNLDKEGVSGYLRHKMAVAGFNRESPFTPRIVDSIYSNSGGVPEKINFFASKFLASSGKGDNYIERETNIPDPVDNLHSNGMASAQENDLMGGLTDDELKDHRTDRAEEQISRLAEKFEEIEQMGGQDDDTFFSNEEFNNKELNDEELFDREQVAEDFIDKQPTGQSEFYKMNSLGMPKFIIPIALIGIILVAFLVFNSAFNKSGQAGDGQTSNEKIELLPLELPAENSLTQENSLEPEKSAQPEVSLQNEQSTIVDGIDQTVKSISDTVPELELVEPGDSELKTVQAKSTEQTSTIVDSVTAGQTLTETVVQSEFPGESDNEIKTKPAAVKSPAPVLRTVEPEPVIGSASRQYITISGSHLETDVSLVVVWGEQSKEFSAKLTPEQWFYESKSKIKLHLATGIDSQQWQIYAKSADGQQSETRRFDVVKPYIADLTINSIVPNPVIGSDKRQTVAIMGRRFSRQTVIELKWDNNKKLFSSLRTPTQFEFVSEKQIKLFVTTGKKERQWHVSANNPPAVVSSSAVFAVVPESHQAKASASGQPPGSSNSLTENNIRNKSWLQQQADDNFTIQLFGSHNKQAIEQLIRKYSLKGDIARFETQRNGQTWFSMTYGNYASKQAANDAITALDSELSNPKPWVRSFASIKNKLKLQPATADKNISKKPVVSSSALSSPALSSPALSSPKLSSRYQPKNEAWIWTQNPADFTVQLLALSTESAVREFISKQNIQTEAVYFKILRNEKPLYVLLYGSYPDKNSALQAKEQLAAKIKLAQPWVRSFSEIHGMMSNR